LESEQKFLRNEIKPAVVSLRLKLGSRLRQQVVYGQKIGTCIRAEESNLADMAGTANVNSVGENGAAQRAKPVRRASSFKYYIHDGVEACRLQLIGELSEREVMELDGCWRTMKGTLGSRRLILDLRAVTAVDDAGKRWLASMGSDRAEYLPEGFMQRCISGEPLVPTISGPELKLSMWGKFWASVRARTDAAES
jgi:hypothetical protein